MKTAPVIVVQLIHIEGPLKGQIVELTDPVIEIGRHPSCQVRFPPDFNIISRRHATITREGNRFRIKDHSANGTVVNGRRIKETYLKDGDVITIAQEGPKISFLTRVEESSSILPEGAVSPQTPPPETEKQQDDLFHEPVKPRQPLPQSTPEAPQLSSSVQASPEPLIVQYGPTLRSFELPVRVGRHADNDFVIDHPAILDMHAEVFFNQGQYWIRDLTGRQMVTVNTVPVGDGAPLRQNDRLALGPQGPFFQFLGDGRLSEVDTPPAGIESPGQSVANGQATENHSHSPDHRHPSFFQKILKKF